MEAEPTSPSSGVRPPGPPDITTRWLLNKLTEMGDLLSWIEMEDDGLHFQCWRLNPEKFPEEYQRVKGPRWKTNK